MRQRRREHVIPWRIRRAGIFPPMTAIHPYSRTIERVRTALTGTFAETDTWFDRPEPLRSFHPSDGGWTIDEILEHITLTSEPSPGPGRST
jgi:hypothetical protein